MDTLLKPCYHVQLLHAIILASGRDYRCQSVCVCVTSFQKVGWRSLLLLSAAASAATMLLVAISNFNGKRDYVTSTSAQALRHVIPSNAVIGCNTFAPYEYFPTRLNACNYCMQELQRVACNN